MNIEKATAKLNFLYIAYALELYYFSDTYSDSVLKYLQ